MSEQLLQEMEQPGQEEEESGIKKRVEELKEEAGDDGEKSKDENPLEKYMKMVLEAREKQHVQVSCIHICVKLLQTCSWHVS